jgi:hypothetical protein
LTWLQQRCEKLGIGGKIGQRKAGVEAISSCGYAEEHSPRSTTLQAPWSTHPASDVDTESAKAGFLMQGRNVLTLDHDRESGMYRKAGRGSATIGETSMDESFVALQFKERMVRSTKESAFQGGICILCNLREFEFALRDMVVRGAPAWCSCGSEYTCTQAMPKERFLSWLQGSWSSPRRQ